jgi:hypothetical protein
VKTFDVLPSRSALAPWLLLYNSFILQKKIAIRRSRSSNLHLTLPEMAKKGIKKTSMTAPAADSDICRFAAVA